MIPDGRLCFVRCFDLDDDLMKFVKIHLQEDYCLGFTSKTPFVEP